MATTMTHTNGKHKSDSPSSANGKKHRNGKKRAKTDENTSDASDESDFIEINQYIKLDLKSNVLLSNDKIDSGTRILIELPLFKIGRPTQTSHPGNSLFLYHSFINSVSKGLQKEILYSKYPLKKLNKNIASHTQNLKKLVKKNTKLNANSVIKYNNKQWKEIEILQNIFHSYSISLQLLSDPYHVVYDHYNNIRFQTSKTAKDNPNNSGFVPVNDNEVKTNIHACDDAVMDLGKGIYERASLLSHACNPCCRVNVIDEKGTIEIRTLVDIPGANIPLTRNFLDDTRGLGIESNGSSANDYETRVLMNDDINLIPCNMRLGLLLKHYHFICECCKCQSWDRTRSLLCCDAQGSHGCKGFLWSRPPYLLWKCQSCERLIAKEKLSESLRKERKFCERLRGIEDIINIGFSKAIDVSQLLYPLLNECTGVLGSGHWIVLRLLWVCFEEKLCRNYLPHSLIYLKRHIEGCEAVNDYAMNPCLIMANKYELISDLLPYDERYKQESIKKAIKVRDLLHGKGHSSVKRCGKKLRFYKDMYQKQMN